MRKRKGNMGEGRGKIIPCVKKGKCRKEKTVGRLEQNTHLGKRGLAPIVYLIGLSEIVQRDLFEYSVLSFNVFPIPWDFIVFSL